MAGRILGLRRKRWRFAFGGLFAAVCDWRVGFSFFAKKRAVRYFSLLLLAGGVFIAYTPKSGKIFLRLMGTTLLSSFLLGGGSTAFVYLYAGTAIVWAGSYRRADLSVVAAAWAVLLAYVLLKLGAGWMETHICPQT